MSEHSATASFITTQDGPGTYETLTTRELTVLQDVLFGATEKAFESGGRSFHEELAMLFLEAGNALLSRLVGYEAAA